MSSISVPERLRWKEYQKSGYRERPTSGRRKEGNGGGGGHSKQTKRNLNKSHTEIYA